MPANVEIGSHVWVEDPEVAWIDGIVINIEQDEVEVQTSDGKTVRDFLRREIEFIMIVVLNYLLLCSLICAFYSHVEQVAVSSSRIYPNDVEAPSGGVDDMTRLQYLHEPAVLHNLATRYEINEIYVRLPCLLSCVD